MTTKITGITADLTLQTATFIRDLNKASQTVARNTSAMQRSFGRLESGMSRLASVAKGALAGFIGVQGVQSFARLAAAAVNTADDIGKASTAIGMGAEELQRFRFAAAQADVDVGMMDAALKIFQKNLSTGKVHYKDFNEFIAAIAAAPSHIDKVRIAQEALGKQYQTGILLAAQSAEQFRKQYDEAFVISQRAVDNASEIDNAMRSVGNAITTAFTNGFLEAWDGQLKLTHEQLKLVHETLRDMTFNATSWIAAVIERSQQWYDLLVRINNLLPQIPIPTWMGGPSEGQGLIPPIQTFLGEEKSPFDRLTDSAKSYVEQLVITDGAIQTNAENIGAWSTEVTRAASTQMKTAEATTSQWLGVLDTAGQALGTLFKDNKAVAIAQAVINTAQAITEAMKLPFPINWAQVAAVTALGAAQIATIRSTEPGSSKAISKSSAASSGAAKAGAAASSSRRSSSGSLQQAVVINIEGESFGPEHFRRLVTGLNAVIADGATLRVS